VGGERWVKIVVGGFGRWHVRFVAGRSAGGLGPVPHTSPYCSEQASLIKPFSIIHRIFQLSNQICDISPLSKDG
jgi:hypothetical protein